MKCKIFYNTNRQELEQAVNKWLEETMISPGTIQLQFSTVAIEDADSYQLHHTLVLFYVPMYPVGR